MKVWIATPSLTGRVTCEFAASLAETLAALRLSGISAEWHSLADANLLHFARDQMARDFMESDATEFLFIDDDMKWAAVEIVEMVRRHEDVIGGLVPTKRGWNAHMTGLELDGLLECEYVGTGIMRIRRPVFEQIGRPYFDARYEGERRIGEDAWFCREVKRHGGTIWAMPMTVSHRGMSVSRNMLSRVA